MVLASCPFVSSAEPGHDDQVIDQARASSSAARLDGQRPLSNGSAVVGSAQPWPIPRRTPAALTALAMALSVSVAVPLGVLAAWRQGSWIDRIIMLFSVSGFSMPVFWLGFLLVWVFRSHASSGSYGPPC